MRTIRLILALAIAIAFILCGAEAAVEYNEGEWRVLFLTNKHRAANGSLPLSLTENMQRAARIRAKEIGELFDFDHLRPDGRKWLTVFADIGIAYQSAAENLAIDYYSAEEVVEAWIESRGHNETMIKPVYHHIGIGKIGEQWTQLYLTRNCGVKGLNVSLPSGARLEYGASIEELNAVVSYDCPDPQHGRCVMPLISEMCSGYDPNKYGQQKVTVALRGQTASMTIYVGEDPPEPTPTPPTPYVLVPVRSIGLSGSKRVMSGQSVKWKAAVKPAKADNKTLKWESSDPDILTVDDNGLISAREGIEKTVVARVTATANDNSGVSSSTNITVYPATSQIAILLEGIAIDVLAIQKSARSVKLMAVAEPVEATQSFKWSSVDSKIAAVNKKGKVTLKKKGEVAIRATSTDGTGVYGEVILTIN